MAWRPIRINPSRPRVPGTIYLLHFPAPYRHARHYLGWTLDVEGRMRDHVSGRGSPLVYRACQAAGITTAEELMQWITRTWSGDRYEERRLKNFGGSRKHCPSCKTTQRRKRCQEQK